MAEKYDEKLGWLVDRIRGIMTKEYPDKKEWDSVLEVPCGPERASFLVLDFMGQTFTIDSRREYLDKALRKYENENPFRLGFLQTDFKEGLTMFPEVFFDLILIYDHVRDDWENAKKIMLKLLKPTGLLVFYSCLSAQCSHPDVDQLFKFLSTEVNPTSFSDILPENSSEEIEVSHELTLDQIIEWFLNEKNYHELLKDNSPLVKQVETQLKKLEGLKGNSFKVTRRYTLGAAFKKFLTPIK